MKKGIFLRRALAAVLCAGMLLGTAALAAAVEEEEQDPETGLAVELYQNYLDQERLETEYQNGRYEDREYLTLSLEVAQARNSLLEEAETLADEQDTSSGNAGRLRDEGYRLERWNKNWNALVNRVEDGGITVWSYRNEKKVLDSQRLDITYHLCRYHWENIQKLEGLSEDAVDVLFRQHLVSVFMDAAKEGYTSGQLTKSQYEDLRDRLKKRESQLRVKEARVERQDSLKAQHPAIRELSYQDYLDLVKRIEEIDQELDALADDLKAGKVTSTSYWERKAMLEEERSALMEEKLRYVRDYE